MEYKICKKCGESKEIVLFYKHRATCISCVVSYNKEYRSINKTKVNETKKLWYVKTRNDRRAHKAKYYVERRKTDTLFKLKSSISRLIRTSISRFGFKKTSKTYEILGCTYEEFKNHLESKFEPWMSWDNKGLYNGELNYGWDIDHVKPLSSANSEEDIIKLNHFSNYQPLCSKVNRDIKRGL